MRIYLALTPADLAAELPPTQRAFGPAGLLEDFAADEEMAESLAFDLAAWDSFLKVQEEGGVSRVVAAADCDQVKLLEQPRGAVAVLEDLSWSDVVSIHVDDQVGQKLLSVARSDPKAQEQLRQEPLAWFDISERDYLIKHFHQ